MKKPKLPDQPMCWDGSIIRWKKNRLVCALLDTSQAKGFGMNELCLVGASKAERQQFAQLIGYSVSGWGSLNYVPVKRAIAADKQAEKMYRKRFKRKGVRA